MIINAWKNDSVPTEEISSQLPSTATGALVTYREEIKDYPHCDHLKLKIYHVINFKGHKGFHATVSTTGFLKNTDFVAGTDSTAYNQVLNDGKALIETEYEKLFNAGRWRD